uniref:Uncharacterized protein n=1 Tax=Tanacetum cinerariifolium TaxID=118510 RepID=A0A6L2NXW0_TANCI|nr:hypothetical protein [Tanacetum cinerariifolium]
MRVGRDGDVFVVECDDGILGVEDVEFSLMAVIDVASHPFLNSSRLLQKGKSKQAKRNEKPGRISITGAARSSPGLFPQRGLNA